MPNNRKTATLLAGLAIGGSAIAGCSLQRTQSNEWGCSFGKGPWDTVDLKDSYSPGEKGPWSNDRFKTGPSDIRFYYIDSNPATADFGALPIVVPAKGSAVEGVGVVETSTEVQVRFTINENFCQLYIDNLKRIDDRVDLNYNAKTGEESGWAEFLNQTMNQKLIEATRPVLRDVDYITLYTNGAIDGEAAYDRLAGELSTNLTRQLKADLGDDFFCGPSYKFDGTIDGKLGGVGCPPLEVTVKSIKPTNGDLITNLQTIVTNEEQQRKIESDTVLAKEQTRAEQERAIATAQANEQKAVAQAAADQATKVAQAEANTAIQVAEANQQRQVALAQQEAREAAELRAAEIDLAVARARAEVAQQQATNKIAGEQANAAFCIALAQVNIRCDLLASAEAGGNIVPNYNLAGSADGGSAATVVLDARP
jgi:hypothetical protein